MGAECVTPRGGRCLRGGDHAGPLPQGEGGVGGRQGWQSSINAQSGCWCQDLLLPLGDGLELITGEGIRDGNKPALASVVSAATRTHEGLGFDSQSRTQGLVPGLQVHSPAHRVRGDQSGCLSHLDVSLSPGRSKKINRRMILG